MGVTLFTRRCPDQVLGFPLSQREFRALGGLCHLISRRFSFFYISFVSVEEQHTQDTISLIKGHEKEAQKEIEQERKVCCLFPHGYTISSAELGAAAVGVQVRWSDLLRERCLPFFFSSP